MTLKEQLIAQAKKLGLKTEKLTIVQLKEALKKVKQTKTTEEKITQNQSISKTKEETATPIKSEQTLVQPENNMDKNDKPQFAKAGKRSQKSIEEAQAEAERLARKEEATTEAAKTRPKIIPKTRLKIERRGKKYKKVAPLVDRQKTYAFDEALKLVIQTSVTKFDSSLDLVMNLNIDVKKPDQNIRDFVVLPNGIGKKIRVAVLAHDKEAKAALEVGADIAGHEIFLQQLDKGLLNFDILIAMPDLMINLGKYAQLLGPKGLMPNPKSGTITKDIVTAVKNAKAGRVEYRADENGLIHLSLGKVSFGHEKLADNFKVILQSIVNNKPSSLKGIYIKSLYLHTTMGPSVKAALPT